MSAKHEQRKQESPRSSIEKVLDKVFGMMRSDRDKRIMEEVQKAQGDVRIVGIDTIVRTPDKAGDDPAKKAQLAKRRRIANGLVQDQ